ncbi:MAG: HNH endonuclease [Acidimicrobiia bacterium]|nr:HNH endonuclease [Acidimicrobiia bacterium]
MGSGVVGVDFRELDSAIDAIEVFVRDFEPGLLDARGAVRAVERFAKVTHLGQAGTALAVQQVDRTHAYRESGARCAADWLARKTGVASASAFRAMETADALSELPATNAAFRAGKLSEAQAHEIAGAARKDPTAEAELVAVAARGTTMKGLKDRCRQVRASAEVDDAAWAQRLRDNRSLRTWVDPDTAPCGMWRTTPDKGAEINAALDAETDLLFRAARAAGGREAREAYAADALHALITRGPRKATGATLVMDAGVADAGFASRGQRCEIPGIGPIPVTIAKQMLATAKIRELPADPALLPDYATDRRYYPPWMLAWLDQHYPVCGVEGCDADFHLEIDHVVPKSEGGLTAIPNLWLICWYHHRLKTNEDWLVTGTTHNWDLVPPNGGPDPP